MLCCDTGAFPAVCAGEAKMTHIDDTVVDLALRLEPRIKAITDEGEITLRVKHGWVASIGTFIVEMFHKIKTVD
jgi:hypothetical protein